MYITFHMDNKKYSMKPRDVARINNEVIKNTVSATPQELSTYLTEGHTVVLATMKDTSKRSMHNMAQQQAVMLDFDNKDKNGNKTHGAAYTSIQDILQDDFIQEHASFIYKTFSHEEGHDKFRVVFILDKPLTSNDEVNGLYRWLLSKYPNADEAIKDSSRIFYGGTEALEIDFNNIMSVSPQMMVKAPEKKRTGKIKPSKKVTPKPEAKPEAIIGEIPTWKLIQNGNKQEVKKRLSVYGCAVNSLVQAKNILKRINLRDFMGEHRNPCFDFFHYESNPSASMFQMEDSTIWLYKCHSTSNPFVGDIVRLTQRLLNVTHNEALAYLMDVTGITLATDNRIQDIRNQCDLMADMLLSEDLKVQYPAVNNMLWRYKKDMVEILFIFKESVYEENGEARCLSWYSAETLSNRIYGHKRKAKTIERILSLMSLNDWVAKLDDKEIPNELLLDLKTQQLEQKRNVRSNVFEVHLLGDNFNESLNNQCESLKGMGFTMRGFGREWVERSFGKDRANELFPQHKHIEISETSDKLTMSIHRVTMQLIEKKGFAHEDDIVSGLKRIWKSQGMKKTQLKRSLSEMMELYNLDRIRLDKTAKEKYGKPAQKYKGSPIVIVKQS
jgi:hypothetical protein